MKIEMTKLVVAKRKMDSEVSAIEQKLVDILDFGFSIVYQNSDGWTICDDEANVATLSMCLTFIKKEGGLTHDQFLTMCI